MRRRAGRREPSRWSTDGSLAGGWCNTPRSPRSASPVPWARNRALMNPIDGREVPIPVYGELGSINPLVVTAGAAAERPDDIGQGLAGSMSLGVGQFCTKPGLAFVPSGEEGDRLVAAAGHAVSETPAAGRSSPQPSSCSARSGPKTRTASALASQPGRPIALRFTSPRTVCRSESGRHSASRSRCTPEGPQKPRSTAH